MKTNFTLRAQSMRGGQRCILLSYKPAAVDSFHRDARHESIMKQLIARDLLIICNSAGRYPLSLACILTRLSALVISASSIFSYHLCHLGTQWCSHEVSIYTRLFFIDWVMEINFVSNFGSLFLFHFELNNWDKSPRFLISQRTFFIQII